MNNISLFIAFGAGIVSFLAPCVLPIVPGFLAYLAGASAQTAPGEGGRQRREIFLNSLFFVLGFSLVFAALGVLLNTILLATAGSVQVWLARIGGAFIIFFGIYLMGLIRVPFLEREYKFGVTRRFRSRYLTSLVFGAAFAAGWTPCVGAALGAILGLAAAQPGLAFWLLLAYALGLGVPFLIVGFFAVPVAALASRWQKVLSIVNIVFGALLVALGVLIFTGDLSLIANFDLLNRWLLSQSA